MNRGLVAFAFCVALVPPVTLAVPPPRDGSPTIIGIGFIGDSITSGERVSRPPTAVVTTMLTNRSTVALAFNRGRSGTTTWDWLPGRGLLESAKRSFAANRIRRVHIALGTNDAKRLVETTPESYAANLAAIAKDLEDAGFEPVISAPPELLAKSPCGEFAAESPSLVRAYAQAAARSKFAGRGAAASFAVVDNDPGLLSRDLIHPMQDGSDRIGAAWAFSLR